jgi:hypothetical protein
MSFSLFVKRSINCLAILASFCPAIGLTAEPLFPNSIVSNDIDFITAEDPAVFGCLKYEGEQTREMPGSIASDELLVDDVHVFQAYFSDGSQVSIWVHPRVGNHDDLARFADLLLLPLGRLPKFMRQELSHIVIQAGDETAFAEHLGRFFVVYHENMLRRITTHDLDETVFHETVHATLEAEWGQSLFWQRAQISDGDFITDYAASRPELEDLPESALFAYTYLMHPGRLPPNIVQRMEQIMPARLAFFEGLFGNLKDETRAMGDLLECDSTE